MPIVPISKPGLLLILVCCLALTACPDYEQFPLLPQTEAIDTIALDGAWVNKSTKQHPLLDSLYGRDTVVLSRTPVYGVYEVTRRVEHGTSDYTTFQVWLAPFRGAWYLVAHYPGPGHARKPTGYDRMYADFHGQYLLYRATILSPKHLLLEAISRYKPSKPARKDGMPDTDTSRWDVGPMPDTPTSSWHLQTILAPMLQEERLLGETTFYQKVR